MCTIFLETVLPAADAVASVLWVERAARQFGAAVAGETFEGPVAPLHATGGIGEHHGVMADLEDGFDKLRSTGARCRDRGVHGFHRHVLW